MTLCYIGTSGWSYKEWIETFYPPHLSASEFLSFYMQHFSTVEINAGFYRLPFKNMIKSWYNKAPEGFLYAVKGSRLITHLKKLNDVEQALFNFLERISPLGAFLGPILWQLPPSLHKDTERLESFLSGLPTGFRYAVEFRHPSWIDKDVFYILQKHQVASVSVSSMKMPMDLTVTTDFVYIRFHGLQKGYCHDYTSVELEPWAEHIRQMIRQKQRVFAYFNNDGNTRAPENAKDLINMVR